VVKSIWIHLSNFFDFFFLNHQPNPQLSFFNDKSEGNEWHQLKERVPLPPRHAGIGLSR
jgi:hypothetical protein